MPFPCTRACAYGPSGGSSVCSATAPCRRGAPAATTPTPTASLQRAGATAPSAARPPKREADPKAQRRYEHRRKGRVAEKAREVVPKAAEKTVHARASPRAEAAHSRQQVAVSKSSTTVAKEALGQDSKVVQKFHHRRHRRSSIRNRMALQAHQGYSHLKKHGQEAMQRCTPCGTPHAYPPQDPQGIASTEIKKVASATPRRLRQVPAERRQRPGER